MTVYPDHRVFRAAKVSPLVEEVFGQAWAAIAWREGHRPGLPSMPKWTLIRDEAQIDAILDATSDEWQTSREIAARANCPLYATKNVLTHYYGIGRIERLQPNGRKDAYQWRWRSGSMA